MKLLTALVLALACFGAPSIQAAETPPAPEQNDVAVYEAELGKPGGLQVMLKPGEVLGAITAPGFELGDPVLMQEGDDDNGVHCRILCVPAKPVTIGLQHITIEVLAADGWVSHVERFDVNVK